MECQAVALLQTTVQKQMHMALPIVYQTERRYRPGQQAEPTLHALGRGERQLALMQPLFQIANGQPLLGIETSLVTTVAGLIVGIIALFAYNYIVARISGVMNLLEGKTMEFMDLLNEPA